jgi:hypothetical protein
MIIGGVHGSEPQGASVVEQVRTGLMTTTPFFSTLLVPTLIRRTAGTGQRYVGETGSQVARHQGSSSQRYRTAGGARGVEPNRTYPGAPHLDEPSTGWAGQDYQSALQSGLLYQPAAGATPRAPAARSSRPRELAADDVHSSRMIAETRALIALIENFQPERIASIHAHSVPGRRGDAPGVFVDPRGGYGGGSPTSVGAATAEGQADDQLALAMLHQGLTDPRSSTNSFRGNTAARGGVTGETVHYATSNHPEGSSLGDWAPSRGITTVTVEVPQGLKGVPLADVEEMHRDLLMQIFLADPSSVTPGSFTTPTPMRGVSNAPAPRRAF